MLLLARLRDSSLIGLLSHEATISIVGDSRFVLVDRE